MDELEEEEERSVFSSLRQTQMPNLVLSPEQQLELEKTWDARNLDPLPYTPHELRERVTREENELQNREMGRFAVGYLKSIFARSTSADVARRIKEGKKVVAVGYGLGHDSKWLLEATLAGYQTWWIDVSRVSAILAKFEMSQQWQLVQDSMKVGAGIKPVVVQAEAMSALLESEESIGLDLKTVEGWYFCRTINVMPRKIARNVLQIIGRSLSEKYDPKKNHWIILVNALKETNPGRVGKTSTMPSRRLILSYLKLGAGRPLKVENEATHPYYDSQVYTAMMVKAG